MSNESEAGEVGVIVEHTVSFINIDSSGNSCGEVVVQVVVRQTDKGNAVQLPPAVYLNPLQYARLLELLEEGAYLVYQQPPPEEPASV